METQNVLREDDMRIDPVNVFLHSLRHLKVAVKRLILFIRNFRYEMKDADSVVPHVMSLEATLNKVLTDRVSLCRFGDGEFDMCVGVQMSFQRYDETLRVMLNRALSDPQKECLVCLPDVFSSLSKYTEDERWFWRTVMCRRRHQITARLSPMAVYGNSFVSRCYLRYRDKNTGNRIFALWKKIFAQQDLLIVEGRYSRIGIGNDLLDGARSIRRIWCPATDAFAKYDQIFDAIRICATKDTLIVLALGATATVLAHNLAKEGYWAVDAGHLDIEYIWMKMGVSKKCAIPNRYMVECPNGRSTCDVPGEVAKNDVIEIIS